jgi:hypothetical protein
MANSRSDLVVDYAGSIRPAAAHCKACGTRFRVPLSLTAYQATLQVQQEFDAHTCKQQQLPGTKRF